MKGTLVMILVFSVICSYAYADELVMKMDFGIASYNEDHGVWGYEEASQASISGKVEFLDVTKKDLSGSISFAEYAGIDRASFNVELASNSNFLLEMGLYYYKGRFSEVYETMHSSNDHSGQYSSLQLSVNPAIDLKPVRWLEVRSGFNVQVPLLFSSEGQQCVRVESPGYYGCTDDYVNAGIEDFTSLELYPWAVAEIAFHNLRLGLSIESTMQEDFKMEGLITRKSLTIGYAFPLFSVE